MTIELGVQQGWAGKCLRYNTCFLKPIVLGSNLGKEKIKV
jgi:hypothetical protein